VVDAERSADGAAFTEDDWREMVLRLAHEIRNPLATIKSGVQLTQHVARPQGDIADCLESVLTQVGRIDRTVQDLQRFVRIGAGRPVAVPIGRAIEDAVTQRRPEALRQGIGLSVSAGPALHAFIDPGNLAIAIDELLSNAIRFSEPGAAIVVSWLGDARQILVHVDDEGPGVKPELADRVGRPFFSTSTSGTGLGINITDKICRVASGRLEWRNRSGCGCRFTLCLPAA
jgi:signal transduction histidine kinase